MKLIYIATLIFILCIPFSCRDKYDNCTEEDYANCDTERPGIGRAVIHVTINDDNPYVPVSVYEGNFEQGHLLFRDTLYEGSSSFYLETEKFYSFTATYGLANDTTIAVDGGEVGIISYQMCELRCYEVRVLDIDLKLLNY